MLIDRYRWKLVKNLRNGELDRRQDCRLEAAISHGRVNRRKGIIGIRALSLTGSLVYA